MDALAPLKAATLLTLPAAPRVEVIKGLVGQAAPRLAPRRRTHAPTTRPRTALGAVAAHNGPLPHLPILRAQLGARPPHATAGMAGVAASERQVL